MTRELERLNIENKKDSEAIAEIHRLMVYSFGKYKSGVRQNDVKQWTKHFN